MSNIRSYGIYFPHYQVSSNTLSPNQKRSWTNRIAYVDEDIITMAYESANRCISKSTEIDAVFFATTSPVFKDRYHASFLANLLNLPNGIFALDFGTTPRAGTDALLLANDLVNAGKYNNVLIVASEKQFPQIGEEKRKSSGHGAISLLIGKESGKTEVRSAKSYSSAMAEEFQYKGGTIGLDPRFARNNGFKSSLKLAIDKSNLQPGDVDTVVLNSIYSKIAGGVFQKAGFAADQFFNDSLTNKVGYTNCCHALLQLVDAIESGKKDVMLLDYYNGTNMLHIKSAGNETKKTLNDELSNPADITTYQDYLTIRKSGNFNSLKYRSKEVFSSEMMNERERENLIYLKGYCCDSCDTVYLLKSARCKKCKGEKFTQKELKKTGTVYTLTREHYFPTEFPPITMVVIDLDGGGRITCQMTDDMYLEDKGNIEIGSKVELVIRMITPNDANPDYFLKARRRRN